MDRSGTPVEFGNEGGVVRDDVRLTAPAAGRNQAAITEVLGRRLGDLAGDVLEIGSGTGQHVVAFARALPRLTWWPTDPDPDHRQSIDAWRGHAGLGNVRPAMTLDAAEADWRLGAPGLPPADRLVAILAINVAHIAPWAVTEGLIRGAGRHLGPGGQLLVYGAFARDGRHIAASNARFDASLRRQNPAWGVRDTADVAALAAEQGLALADVVTMPANNLTLVLTKDGA